MSDEPTVACPECDGKGWVRLPVSDHWSSGAINDCPLCDGRVKKPPTKLK
jgi:predicted nucleic acid-binding Zn ribbon protein